MTTCGIPRLETLAVSHGFLRVNLANQPKLKKNKGADALRSGLPMSITGAVICGGPLIRSPWSGLSVPCGIRPVSPGQDGLRPGNAY